MRILIIGLFVMLAITMVHGDSERLGRLGTFENGTALINDAFARLELQLADELGPYYETNAPVDQVSATNMLTIAVNPTTNDTFTIGDDTYTFVTNIVDGNDIVIGSSVASTQTNVVAEINADGLVVAGAFGTNNVSLLTIVSGGVGTDVATTSDFTAVGTNKLTYATMTGGVDMVPSTAADMLISSGFLYIRNTPTTWKKITLESL